jgi:uncharacterized protein
MSAGMTFLFPSTDAMSAVLRRFHWLLYLAVLIQLMLFWPLIDAASVGAKAYVLIASVAYAGLYVLPVIFINTALAYVMPVAHHDHRWRLWLRYGVTLLSASAVVLAIYADYRLYGLYQYHVNGFVLNLLSTPGGLAALGATTATERTVALQMALMIACVGCVLGLLHAFAKPAERVRGMAAFLVGMMLLLGGVEFSYAYSSFTGREELLAAADAIPFRVRSSASSLLSKLGVERSALKALRFSGGEVDYHGAHLPAQIGAKPPNVIMLVGESFRWDLLSPGITPNLWRLASKGTRYANHYSGGNRTRMGLFSLFYGIYAPYWYSFERQRVAPALMNFMREHDYQIVAHTSQSFDYPELRHTVFAGVPERDLREIKTGEPWQRDVQNIDELIAKLDGRDKAHPFYNFMFFESTHAAYSFPESKALRSGYLKEVNYIKLNLADNIDAMHTRYINAAHHVDEQVGRLVSALESRGLLDKTIILFTGDHGEEFMEKGHWGHGHGNTFPEEQIRVPLVMHVPGQAEGEVVNYRTSHLQVAPTLLGLLGVTAPSRSYSLADPLTQPMESSVLGEYDYMGLADAHYKITFPYTGTDFFRYRVSDQNDHPLDRTSSAQVLAQYRLKLDQVALDSARFLKH